MTKVYSFLQPFYDVKMQLVRLSYLCHDVLKQPEIVGHDIPIASLIFIVDTILFPAPKQVSFLSLLCPKLDLKRSLKS